MILFGIFSEPYKFRFTKKDVAFGGGTHVMQRQMQFTMLAIVLIGASQTWSRYVFDKFSLGRKCYSHENYYTPTVLIYVVQLKFLFHSFAASMVNIQENNEIVLSHQEGFSGC